MVGKMERQIGALETPGSLPRSHPGAEGDPRLLLRGQRPGRDNSALYNSSTAQLCSGLEMSPSTHREQKPVLWWGGWLFLGSSLFLTKYLTGNVFRAHQRSRGPACARVAKSPVKPNRERRSLGSQGNTNGVKTQKFSFIHFQPFRRRVAAGTKIFSFLNSPSQAFVPSMLQCVKL